jgi:ssDNA-binding Zn-finger/Zn-ribbon topoisomerase 1
VKDVFPSGVPFPIENSPRGDYRKVDGVRYNYDKDKTACPVCGGIGMPWNGWFACDGKPDCDAIAWIETGEVLRPATTQGDKP